MKTYGEQIVSRCDGCPQVTGACRVGLLGMESGLPDTALSL
jgi:hypothetical protein